MQVTCHSHKCKAKVSDPYKFLIMGKIHALIIEVLSWGWLGGAMVLCVTSSAGRPTDLESCRARSNGVCSRCGWGCSDFFSLLSPTLWETARCRLKDCLKGPLNPKQSNMFQISLTSRQLKIHKAQSHHPTTPNMHSRPQPGLSEPNGLRDNGS